MLSDDEIKAGILFRLHRRGNWGASHTAFDNLGKGWNDRDLGKHGVKRIDKLAKELIRQGWMVPKPTSYGLQVALNPRQSESIVTFIRRFFLEIRIIKEELTLVQLGMTATISRRRRNEPQEGPIR